MNDKALRRRLQRLGRRRRGSRLPTKVDAASSLRELPPGEEIDTPFGPTYLIQTKYPLDYLHGTSMLSDLFYFDSTLASEVARQPRLRETSLKQLIFIDTETTGLVGGAGTIAFMVGVGAFVEDTFQLRQYFLRDPGEERGMLHALQGDIEVAAGFVSYNGRAFDLPLLEMRYMLGLRRHWSLSSWPQLDLLHPATAVASKFTRLHPGYNRAASIRRTEDRGRCTRGTDPRLVPRLPAYRGRHRNGAGGLP